SRDGIRFTRRSAIGRATLVGALPKLIGRLRQGPAAAFRCPGATALTARLTHAALVVLIAAPGRAWSASGDRLRTQDQGKADGSIALILPGVSGVEGRATDYGAGLRELFASFLKGPSMQVPMLEARLPALAIQEAQQKGCDNVLSV